MKNKTQEKMLIKVNEDSIFYKIKMFFRNIFSRNKVVNNTIIIEEKIDSRDQKREQKNSFVENIKNIEDEQTKLLKLQKKYRIGEITEEDLTEEQINALCKLFDKQIETLKKSLEIREARLKEYRKKLQTNN